MSSEEIKVNTPKILWHHDITALWSIPLTANWKFDAQASKNFFELLILLYNLETSKNFYLNPSRFVFALHTAFDVYKLREITLS